MSLHFLDGFGAYANGAHTQGSGDDLNLQWQNYGSVEITALSSGTNGTRKYLTGSLGDNAEPDLDGLSSSTIVLGFRLWHEFQAGANLVVAFLNASNNRIGSVGLIEHRLAYSASTNGDLSNTNRLISTFDIKKRAYHYVEMKIVFNDTTGSVDFFVDGIAAGSVSGVDTQAAGNPGPCTKIRFMENTSGDDWQSLNRLADIYVDDLTVHGPVEIYYQEVNAAGTESAWTPSAGANHETVDEIGQDGDGTYNSSTVVANTDSMLTTKALDEDPLAIQTMAHARKVSGTTTFKVGIKSDPGGTPTESFGSTDGLTTTYHGYRGLIEEVDPDTSAAWLKAGADAAEVIYEQVT